MLNKYMIVINCTKFNFIFDTQFEIKDKEMNLKKIIKTNY